MRYKHCETEEGRECMRAHDALGYVMEDLEELITKMELQIKKQTKKLETPMPIHEATLMAYNRVWGMMHRPHVDLEDKAIEAERAKEKS